MSHPVRKAVVLAAGRGARLQPFSGIRPKPLHPICNKPIMQYQLEAARAAGIQEIVVVIGPGGDPIRNYFADGRELDIRIRYVEDPSPAGIASSLALVRPLMDGPFLVFLGDIFLSLEDLTPSLEKMEEGAAGIIVVRRDSPEAIRRNFAVVTDGNGRVARVIEKPVNPPSDLKGCGVYVFDDAIFEAIRRTPRSQLRNEYEITDAVQILIEMGRPLYASDVVRWDVNITFPRDLLECNLRLLREQERERLVGAGARISELARVTSSVVGDRAVIDAAVELSECLVLPDAQVTKVGGSLRQCIFADDLLWAA